MAVTLTVEQLRDALRLADSTEETKEATRLLAYATEAVTQHVAVCPDVAHNEAARRVAGYMYDQPEAASGDGYANALRNSGAGRILLPYRVHRAGYADAVDSAQAAVGSADNPVTGIDVTGDVLTVTYLDGVTETFTVAGGTVGVDQTARDAAAAAQTDIDDHETNHPSGGGGVDQTARDSATNAQNAASAAQGEIDTHEASEHNTDATARAAAATAQTEIETHEASTHNTDITAQSTALNARQTAEQAQTTVETHRASTHNTDGTARTAAANAQITAESARDAAAAAQSDADTAQTTAGQAQATATAAQADIDSHEANHPDGGGTPPTVLYDGTTTLAGGSAKLPGEIVCPQTGFLEIYLEAMAGNRSNSVGSLKAPAARVYAANAAIGATYANNGTGSNIMSIPLGANRAAHISANATDHHIALGSPDAGSAGDYYVRIAHVA